MFGKQTVFIYKKVKESLPLIIRRNRKMMWRREKFSMSRMSWTVLTLMWIRIGRSPRKSTSACAKSHGPRGVERG